MTDISDPKVLFSAGPLLQPARARAHAPDALDYFLFLPSIWLACALGLSLRLIGPLFVVVPLATCIAYATLRLTAPPRLLSGFLLFCVLFAGLSLFRVFPTSWQIYFIPEAVFRQMVPMVGFWAVAWAAKGYFYRQIPNGDPFFGLSLVLFLALIVAPVVMFQQGLRYQGEDAARSMFSLYGAFINNIIIANFFLLSRLFMTADWRRYASLFIFLATAATTPFLQFRIYVAVVLSILCGLSGRLAAIVVVAIFTGVYAIGLHYVPEIMRMSPDSGIRLAFIRDALTSVSDTYGIGIGYGTESVRWVYHFPGMPPFSFLPDPRLMSYHRMLEALSTGVHNSFVQALLRTGVIGFVLFVIAFFAAFPGRNLPRGVKNHASAAFIIIFLACFVNPALESPAQAVGIGLIYGYLLALKARSRNGDVVEAGGDG